MKNSYVLIALMMTAGFTLAASANAAETGQPGVAAQGAEKHFPMTEGEVRKVDRALGKITIKHGPIVNLDMPGMTMVFRVPEVALLDRFRPGDHVRFVAQKIGGALTITRLEAVQ
jgi:Cu/Ag efflux protein CusF